MRLLAAAAVAGALIGAVPVAAAPQGAFLGPLAAETCDEADGPFVVAGTLEDERVVMWGLKGERLTMPVTDGRFSGDAYLGTHDLGFRTQAFDGRIDGEAVHLKAILGVAGHAETLCTATGELTLTPTVPNDMGCPCIIDRLVDDGVPLGAARSKATQ